MLDIYFLQVKYRLNLIIKTRCTTITTTNGRRRVPTSFKVASTASTIAQMMKNYQTIITINRLTITRCRWIIKGNSLLETTTISITCITIYPHYRHLLVHFRTYSIHWVICKSQLLTIYFERDQIISEKCVNNEVNVSRKNLDLVQNKT